MKTLTTLALVGIAVVASSAAVRADAISDQKKTYKILGRDLKNQPAQCHLLTKGEVERIVGRPVNDGINAGASVSGCVWRVTGDAGEGILVTRSPRSSWNYPKGDPQYKNVSGVGEQAYTHQFPQVGYYADGLKGNNFTSVLASGSKATPAMAVAALRLAINR